MVFTAFPDFHWAIEDMVIERDKVVFRSTFGETNKGESAGITPTGKKVDISII
jgi:predicted ester cyclase